MALQRPRGREDFREKLGDLYGSCDPRWCVAGDFNVIFDSPKEKASDGRITSSMRVFNKFIDDSRLFGPPFISKKYTCASCRAATRIDRFLLFEDWIDRFGNPRQTRKQRVTSNHWSIILQIPLFFENMLLEHPSFKANISFWWNTTVRGKWEDYCFMGNLRALKGNRRVWNREVFENVNTRKKEITAGIEDTMSWSWKILWIVL